MRVCDISRVGYAFDLTARGPVIGKLFGAALLLAGRAGALSAAPVPPTTANQVIISALLLPVVDPDPAFRRLRERLHAEHLKHVRHRLHVLHVGHVRHLRHLQRLRSVRHLHPR